MAKKKKPSLATRLASLRGELALAGVLLALLGLRALEPYFWFATLIAELSFHLALASLLAAALLAWRRRRAAGSLLLAFALACGWPLLPLYRPVRPTPPSGPLLQVACAHLSGQPLSAIQLASWVRREQPDVLALSGLDGDPDYRADGYRVLRGQRDSARMLVKSERLIPARERPFPFPSALVRAGRCHARVVALELPNVMRYGGLTAREEILGRLTRHDSAPRGIWLGHLGSRSEARDLAAFSHAHGLRAARPGHGRLATAPAALGGLGFPLSDVLIHGWVGIREAEVEPPLVAEAQGVLRATLELTEPRCRPERPSSR